MKKVLLSILLFCVLPLAAMPEYNLAYRLSGAGNHQLKLLGHSETLSVFRMHIDDQGIACDISVEHLVAHGTN